MVPVERYIIVLYLFISALKLCWVNVGEIIIFIITEQTVSTPSLSSLSVIKDIGKDASGPIKPVMLMGHSATSLEVSQNFMYAFY